jgi:hypothetical protein
LTKVSFIDLTLILTVLHRSKKSLMVLKDITGVYRVHEGGIHSSLKKILNLKLKLTKCILIL